MKRALVLEGGGAKGAYQVGAIKAFNQKKIFFDAAGGTSIGAINSAFYVTRNFNAMYKLWNTLDTEDLFGIDAEMINNLHELNFNKKDLKKAFSSIKSIIKNNGIDTKKMLNLLNKYIKEDRFRRSKIDYALNSFSLSDMKPLEVFKKDIPQGKLSEYILSSAYLPIFKFEKIIDNKFYIDGGVYSNCPIDMFIDAGYEEIYVVKAWRSKLKYKHKKGVKVHVITPRESLGSVIKFIPTSASYNISLGYYDTLKYLYSLDGNKYYFKPYSDKYYKKLFTRSIYKKVGKLYNKGLPIKNDKDFILKIIEKACEEFDIDRFKIYNLPYLLTRLKYKIVKDKDSKYYYFIKNIKIEFE